MNLRNPNLVLFDVMKKILLLTFAAALPFLATSCADYATYSYGSTASVGGGYAPLQVGFVATSFDRWAWDPYCRHYYDRSCGRYWDVRVRNYCSVAPRRYSSAVYPTGHRRGHRLACPTYLPRHAPVAKHRGHSNHSGGGNSNRGRYAPVIHGQSRGVVSLQPLSYSSSNRSRGSSSSPSGSNSRPSSYSPSTRSNSTRSDSSSTNVVPSRRSSSQATQRSGSSSRYQTISATPSQTRSAPTVRSSTYTPRSSSSSSSPRSSSSSSRGSSSRSSSRESSSSKTAPSRSTSSPSRSMSKARQKTR